MNKKQTLDVFQKGILKENPVFILVLGMCPLLAMSVNLEQAFVMGIATTFAMVCSNVFISLIRNIVPSKVRIPCYIIVISTFVILIQMVMRKIMPDLYDTMSVFIALIVVNCIIFARAESFAAVNNPWLSAVDGISMGLGFTLAICSLGFIREVLSAGSIYNQKIFGEWFPKMDAPVLTAFGLIVLGCMMAALNKIRSVIAKKKEGK